MLPATVEYLAAWFGIAWAGAVDVPINNEYKGEFLRHVLADSGASVLIIQDRWLPRLLDLDLPDLRHVFVVGQTDGPEKRETSPFAVMLSHDPVLRSPRAESDLAYIMYTSGTTGASKGVMHANRSALWNAYAWLDVLSLTHEDVAYSMFPLFHVTARSAVVTSTMWAGGQVVLRDGFSVRDFWSDVRSSGATFFAYMGAVIHLLYAQPPSPDDAHHRARIAFGAAAPPELVEPFEQRFGTRLVEVYGSTELGMATAPRGERRKLGTMGLACSHLMVEVHDEQDRPTGAEGEIVARPAVPFAMFQGYWGRPDFTIDAWRNLWFHTGDGGRFDDDGFLVFTDRLNDSIRRRGENISSFEVERAIQSHPQVLECGAYAVPSELTEDDLMIAVVPKPGETIDPTELFRYSIEVVPRFAVPRYLRIVEELPKTPSQRTQKYKLRTEGVTPETSDRQALGIEVPRE
jgi:crotonobetaine/carnitine-CoA ligase